MKMHTKYLLPVLLLGVFFLPSLVGAQQDFGLGETGARLPNSDIQINEADTRVAQYVGTVVNSFLGLIGVVFLILIIYAGTLWLTAGGNVERVKKGRQILTWSVIGLVVIFAAFIITSFVIDAVG